MDEKERSEKDLGKLEKIIRYLKSQPFAEKYKKQSEFAEHYWEDAKHYHQKGDHFASFGCANYAYGILEGVLLKEKGKTFHEIEKG